MVSHQPLKLTRKHCEFKSHHPDQIKERFIVLVKTKTGTTKHGEWEVEVFTRPSIYEGLGKFFTCISIKNTRNSTSIILGNSYSNSEEEASKLHFEYAGKSKALFDLFKTAIPGSSRKFELVPSSSG